MPDDKQPRDKENFRIANPLYQSSEEMKAGRSSNGFNNDKPLLRAAPQKPILKASPDISQLNPSIRQAINGKMQGKRDPKSPLPKVPEGEYAQPNPVGKNTANHSNGYSR